VPDAPLYSDELNRATRARLREQLGQAWSRIEDEDGRRRTARPPNRDRHLLAVLDEHAGLWAGEYPTIYPGHMPDFLALYGVVSILETFRSLDIFPDFQGRAADPLQFRHDMVEFGFAHHLVTYTPYRVQLLRSSRIAGQRVFDLLFGPNDGPTLAVEVKTPREFDGPRRALTPANVRGAISRVWKGAVSGRDPQLPGHRPGLLLLGGVTLQLESLPVFARVAEEWLTIKGRNHPNLWGIVGLTFWSYTRVPEGRRVGDGAEVEVSSHMGVRLAAAENPHYTGGPRIVFTPPRL
jgi:hypothetical protein